MFRKRRRLIHGSGVETETLTMHQRTCEDCFLLLFGRIRFVKRADNLCVGSGCSHRSHIVERVSGATTELQTPSGTQLITLPRAATDFVATCAVPRGVLLIDL
jgi:hypothetical protein